MIFIVGTSYSFQMASMELMPFLENLGRRFDVRAVDEEMRRYLLSTIAPQRFQ